MTFRTSLLLVHLIAIAAGFAYWALASIDVPPEDANIGAGLAVLWLALLGSPLSWPGLAGGGEHFATLAVAGSLLNLLLHLALVRYAVRRR